LRFSDNRQERDVYGKLVEEKRESARNREV
jgi:hypothetical protein